MNSEINFEINQGKLKGLIKTDYKNGKYFSFQGIPYAQPPIGELRFKVFFLLVLRNNFIC